MSSIKSKLAVPGIPIWVTLYLFVVIAFGVVLGIPALLGNGLADTQTIGWGGREFGIALGAIMAAYFRNAVAYAIIFVAGTFRELSDMLEAFDEDPANTTSAVMVGVFLVIGIACAWVSFKAIGESEVEAI